MFAVVATVGAQQVVVTVAQDGEAGQFRGLVEGAVIGELFDAGFIVWSDVPQGFIAANGSADDRLPVQMEYSAVRYAREDGADYLVQVRMADAEHQLERSVSFSVIDVQRPRVLLNHRLQPDDFHRANGDLRRTASRLAAMIGDQAADAIRQGQNQR